MSNKLHKNIHMNKQDFKQVNKVKPGDQIACDYGTLWITQANDVQDYVLSAGEKMEVTKRGKVLVQAMQEADFHFE